MRRPYFGYKYDELRKLFENSRNDADELKRILDELKHRRRPKAVAMRKEVEDCLNLLAKDDTLKTFSANHRESPDSATKEKTGLAKTARPIQKQSGAAPLQPRSGPPVQEIPRAFSRAFHLVEPTSTAIGHPQKRIFSLREEVTLDLPPDAPLNAHYAKALNLLVKEMKTKRAGMRRIELENGCAVPVEDGRKGYQFEYEDTVDLFEGASVIAYIGDKKVNGNIVALMQGALIVSLAEDFGQRIPACVLAVDNTAMLKALSERLVSLGERESGPFNHVLATAAVTGVSAKRIASTKRVGTPSGELNERQQAAFRMALANDISYIWGPPGTGKTLTLTALIRERFDQEKRVLICSNTNQAVDQVLLKLCEAMGISHPAVLEGKIIRIGRIAHETLEREWSPYVTVSGVVDRKSVELQARLQELQSQVVPIREAIEKVDRLLSVWDELDSVKEEERQFESRIGLAHKRIGSADQVIKSLDTHRATLDNELARLQQAGFFRRAFMRSEDAILRDRYKVDRDRAQTEAQIESAKREIADVGATKQKIMDRLERLRRLVPPGTGSRKELENKKAQLEKKLQPLSGQIEVLKKKLADMELAVVQDARIIGATVTKTYLSPKRFVGFDVVVVDEASMVILPALYYAAGLASQQVVISGDFRQLRPIVETGQRVLMETIGTDVFKKAGITEAVEKGTAPPRLVMLDTQYRMQKPICDLISSAMYQGRLKTRLMATPAGHPPAPYDQTLTVVDTSRIWPFVNRDAFRSPYNLMHALAVRNLCVHLHKEGYVRGPGDVGVATPYRAQAQLLSRILKGTPVEGIVASGTVHRYQGDEKRLMVLDIPDGLGEPRVGMFLEAENPQDKGAALFNVGISRAKDHLVVFANLTYLQDKLPDRAMLRDILHAIQSRGQVVDVRDVLGLQPVMDDLRQLQRHFELDLDAEKAGLFRQKDFDAVCAADLEHAKRSIAIFSGFVTPQRVAAYEDLFRRKISERVSIRCVTRPPRANGSIPVDQGKYALDALQAIGCIVDTRWNMHEKVVIIDDRVVWFGSLNMLSHTARTDEMMMRVDNASVALQVGIFLSLKTTSLAEKGNGLAVRQENQPCPRCGSRTCYSRGKYGSFWSCEECNWRESVNHPPKTNKTPLTHSASGQRPIKTAPTCPNCGSPMVRRTGRLGEFYGCSKYPNCTGTRSLSGRRKNSA